MATTKLNQLIAVANGKKSQCQSALTQIHHMVQKSDLLQGIIRKYRPKDEDGERYPNEQKNIQYTATRAISEATKVLSDLFDIIATQDMTNTVAAADVVVDGEVIVGKIPVTHLLFLEKQLIDLNTFIEKIPTLDPAERWTYDTASGSYRTEETESVKTKKIPKNWIKYEATKEHPAQVEIFHEDVVVGYWSTTKFNGGIPVDTKQAMLNRVKKLQEAVKFAREEANSIEVMDCKTGKAVMSYIFNVQ